ncbi:universal stress protein [Spongiivirga citrea]|uniref:Universal stress protein n=1 Tax=Spongiivirga citrea TaxID=1481457 RepID=A0A6M0CG62_9FLAO|nr:universal stress protein [Spongiivirga citrea]NER16831.1 universal stress protein [Spongiivirga citrea]
MKKVLIPTDFSETSSNAIRYAMRLFKYDRSEFIIMNAFADEVYESAKEMNREDFEAFKETYRKNVDNDLQEQVDDMMATSANPKHKYEYESCFGSLVDEVNEIVDRENIDIVVMGTKGKTDDRNLTFGSNTLQVIKYVKCPVLAVPVGYLEEYPQNILFPTDYMVPYKRRELKLLSTLAMSYVATINFLYISDFKGLSHRQLDNRDFLDCSFENNKFSFMHGGGKDITKTINQTITDKNIDMLVMVNQRHSYLENMLYNSTIEKIGLRIKIPFLVLQNLHRK